MDLDLAAFLLDTNEKLDGKGNFVYFGNKASACGSVASQGDNMTGDGDGDGDDEVIKVNLASVPADVKEVLFVASIYQAQQKGQSLKDLDNAHIRIVNEEGQQEIASYKNPRHPGDRRELRARQAGARGPRVELRGHRRARSGELGALATRYGLSVAA